MVSTFATSSFPPDVLATPSVCGRPPTQTRLQELPFGELEWSNFEKLCVRLAAIDGTVEHCQRYGTAGQDQQGIDIFARVSGGHAFHAFQCKRYARLSASQIRDAVTEFLEGTWRERTGRFVICVTVPIEPTPLTEEIQSQRLRLRGEGIEFEAWGAIQLAEALKDLPHLVDDFFGRGWVKAFCGDQAAEALGTRLDVVELERLRRELREFYHRIFHQHDPGVPGGSIGNSPVPPLRARYVEPRVRISNSWMLPEPNLETPGIDAEAHEVSDANSWSPEPRIPDGKALFESTSIDHELALDNWLESSDRLLVIGSPGAGKSSLLRFVALSALDDEPWLPKFARAHPGCIPMWVPFGFWTDLIGSRDLEHCSLGACIRSWLTSHDAGDLFNLLEPALSDGRLILLVDGLDEWRSEDRAGLATQRLIEFIERTSTPIICSSRPYGLERATELDSSISVGTLADLDRSQQEKLATTWFAYWLELGETNRAPAEASSRQFMADIAGRSDLEALARTPLLLVLLARTWLPTRVLPENAFGAYSSLAEYLNARHPQLRANAASVCTHGLALSNEERLSYLCHLAFQMQESGTYEGERESLRAVLVKCAQESGFDARESRELSDAILGQASDASALLVNTSATHVAFFHRGLLEHLAARWVISRGGSQQLLTLKEHVADPRWTEVILGVIQGCRPDERVPLARELSRLANDETASPAPWVLLGAVAFGPFDLSPSLARELADRCFEYVENGSSNSVRRDLAKAVAIGVRSNRVGQQVHRRLRTWFPSGESYRSLVYRALGTTKPCVHVQNALFRALCDDDTSAQLAAAESIAEVFGGDGAVFDSLVQRVRRPARPATQAAFMYALHRGWSGQSQVAELGDEAIESPCTTIRLVGHCIRIARNGHERQDAADLVDMVCVGGDLDFGWKDLALGLLAEHWADSAKLCDLVRKGIGPTPHEELWDDDAWKLAARLLPGDEALIRRIMDLLTEERSYLTHKDEFWSAVTKHAGHEGSTACVEAWAYRQAPWDARWVAAAVCAFPTQKMRSLAFAQVRSRKEYYFWLVNALVKVFSLRDSEVRSLVLKLADGTPTESAYASPFLWELRSEEEVSGRLVELLQDPECKRSDFVLDVILERREAFDLDAVVSAFLSVETELLRNPWSGISQVLTLGVAHPRLIELVEAAAERNGDLLAPVIRGYGNHPEYGSKLVDAAIPGAAIVRRAVVDQLERAPVSVAVDDILARWTRESDSVARATAARTYTSRHGADDDALTGRLVEEATCYGQTFEERRGVAFCGLVELRKLELLLDKFETIGDPIPIRLPLLQGGGKVNPIVVRVLAHEWEYASEVFSDDFLARLHGRDSTSKSEIELLSEVADWIPCDSALARHILQLLDSAETPPPPQLMGFLSRVLPSSEVLLDQCLRVAGVRGNEPSREPLLQARAAEILATQFGSPKVLDELVRDPGDLLGRPGLLVTMCRMCPDHELLKRTYDRAAAERTQTSELGAVELICASAPAARVEQLVRDLVRSRAPRNGQIRGTFAMALIRRTQRDLEVSERIGELVGAEGAPLSLQMAGARISVAARGHSSEVSRWGTVVLSSASKGALWPSVFDIISGRVRCVQDLVWDLSGSVQ